MHAPAMALNQRIIWNSSSLKQIDEAKKQYLGFKRLKLRMTNADGMTLRKFIPDLEEIIVLKEKITSKVMYILCESGDDRITWNKENGKEAKEAKAEFNKLIDQGYKAYSVNSSGKKNKRIHEFDVDAEEIMMVPKTSRG